MKQIIIIHGGDSYNSYDDYLNDLKNSQLDYKRLLPQRKWRDNIIDTFPDADVLLPTMPNSSNAKYQEWKIWFEKLLPHINSGATLIGHSLGAMFLVRYLHAHQLKKPVRKLILIAPGYDEDEHCYGSFKVTSAKGIEKSADEVHFFHSEDDPVVPYKALDKFARDIPSAHIHRFKARNHFLDAEFPELINLIKQK